jgi:hypothetical protein
MRADAMRGDAMRDRDQRNERDRDLRDRDLRAAPLDPRARRAAANFEASSSSAASAASKAAAAFSGMANLAKDEKANLIMKVLQLSNEQINLLPEAQRQSILVLKEQIAKTQGSG